MLDNTAVEPVANLRYYLKAKAKEKALSNVLVVDGLITDLPFPDGFADVTIGGHVFGDAPEAEDGEMTRVTQPGGMIIYCPGNGDRDDERHLFLVSWGYAWARFVEPPADVMRKYWRRV